jgi:HSP20 family protein
MFNLIPKTHNEISDVFDRFFKGGFLTERDFFQESRWLPKTDVKETDTRVIVEAEVPGIKKENIDVYLEGRRLVIHGRRVRKNEEKNENFIRVERSCGEFSRTLTLPGEVDESGTEASYKDGILKIVLRKHPEFRGKKIEVKTA